MNKILLDVFSLIGRGIGEGVGRGLKDIGLWIKDWMTEDVIPEVLSREGIHIPFYNDKKE